MHWERLPEQEAKLFSEAQLKYFRIAILVLPCDDVHASAASHVQDFESGFDGQDFYIDDP